MQPYPFAALLYLLLCLLYPAAFLPYGPGFFLLLLWICARSIGVGIFQEQLKTPPLLGYLLAGVAFKNLVCYDLLPRFINLSSDAGAAWPAKDIRPAVEGPWYERFTSVLSGAD